MNRLSFDRDRVPPPSVVLQRLGIAVAGKMNGSGFWVLRCPFHKEGDERHPSLNVHSVEGYYKCHSCGAKGSGIIHFYMAVTGKDFKETIIALGAVRTA